MGETGGKDNSFWTWVDHYGTNEKEENTAGRVGLGDISVLDQHGRWLPSSGWRVLLVPEEGEVWNSQDCWAHTRSPGHIHHKADGCLGSQLFSPCLIPKWKVPVLVCFQRAISCAVTHYWHLIPAPNMFVKISWSSQQSRHRRTQGRFRDITNLGESLLFALFFWLKNSMFFLEITQT